MTRFDPGRTVFISEVANALPHDVNREAVDDAGEDGIKVYGRKELADVVDIRKNLTCLQSYQCYIEVCTVALYSLVAL